MRILDATRYFSWCNEARGGLLIKTISFRKGSYSLNIKQEYGGFTKNLPVFDSNHTALSPSFQLTTFICNLKRNSSILSSSQSCNYLTKQGLNIPFPLSALTHLLPMSLFQWQQQKEKERNHSKLTHHTTHPSKIFTLFPFITVKQDMLLMAYKPYLIAFHSLNPCLPS